VGEGCVIIIVPVLVLVPVLVHLYRLTPKPVLFYSRHAQVSQIWDTPHPEFPGGL
jgi:hypothetical protein